MLYVSLGSALVYFASLFSGKTLLYEILCFDRALILKGQVWRLFSYALTYTTGDLPFTVIGLFCFFSLGRAMENIWGTLRFNLYYLTGIVLMDIYSLLTGCNASIISLNLSLLLGYATLYPNAHFLLFFFIPVKAWILALLDLFFVAYDVVLFALYRNPLYLLSLVALANYFLFFGKDVLNVVPISWQANFRRLFRKKPKGVKATGAIPFPTAGSYEASTASVKAPYTHRCTVCGRTDATNPELEFRYCSRCNGYYCYCEDHISNHTHVE